MELNFEGVLCRWPIFCLWGHFVVSLRTADAFPVVASLPPKNIEKRRPEMRLLFVGYFVVGSQNIGCCKQPLGEGRVEL